METPGSIRRWQAVLLMPWIFAMGWGSAAHAVEFSKVVIDAGHGGNDKGASRDGVLESALNLQVAGRLEAELKRRGLKTAMTRRSDIYIALGSRVEIANRHESSIFVSIHFNAHPSSVHRGVETYYAGPASLPLARSIQKRMAERLRTENRGVKRRLDFKVLRETKSPAVLLECGFISHPIERRLAKTDVYQKVLVQAISDGIMAVHEKPAPKQWIVSRLTSRTYDALLGWGRHRIDELQRHFRP
jgi:N-acetylmuramoyl-L-alanine amidase